MKNKLKVLRAEQARCLTTNSQRDRDGEVRSQPAAGVQDR